LLGASGQIGDSVTRAGAEAEAVKVLATLNGLVEIVEIEEGATRGIPADRHGGLHCTPATRAQLADRIWKLDDLFGA
jgi:hypothetical protein